jgi:hypothetical protein
MLPAEDLFACVYVLIDYLVAARVIAIPPRPGPAPACSDAELLAIAQVRHLLAGAARPRSWPRWRATGRTCSLTCRTKARRTGASAGSGVHSGSCAVTWPRRSRQMTASRPVPARCRSGTPSRVRGPDSRAGPDGLHARFGRDAAHAEWSCGFRVAVRTDLGTRVVRAWSIVPAAINERDVARQLPETGPPPRDLLVDKGCTGKAFAAGQARRGTAVLIPPAKGQRHQMPPIPRKIIAEWRNRIETTFKEITGQMELARHGAHTFWGLLTRTAAITAAHTLMRVCLAGQ